MKKTAVILLSILTVFIFGIYLLSCFTPNISPAVFWPITFLGLGFPILVIIALGCAAAWFIVNGRVALALVLLFLAGYKNIAAVFAFRLPSTFHLQKDSATLRILDWNVRHFKNSNKNAESPAAERRGMINYMREVDADIILMQEFQELRGPDYYSNINVLRDSLGYKYYYTSADQVFANNNSEFGSAIFSKLPIENAVRKQFLDLAIKESLSTVDVTYGGKKIRLATTHLVSLNLGEPPNKAEFFGRIDSDFILHSSQLEKLLHYDSIHGRQADFVRNVLDKSPYPLIMTGDLNSVPSSYVYHTIKGQLQDAFIQKGSGFGRTYTGLFPTLRIDYIFVDQQFKVLQYTCPKLFLSDHFPLVTDIKWK